MLEPNLGQLRNTSAPIPHLPAIRANIPEYFEALTSPPLALAVENCQIAPAHLEGSR
jgi:hypothetical protein